MKKRIILFTALIGFIYVIVSSYAAGVGINCTGANGSQTNCSGPSCHGTKSGTDVYISVKDGSGHAVGSYTAGQTYTIYIGGTNGLSKPVYGFQFTAVKGFGTSQNSAGNYAAFPPYVTSNIYGGLRIVEQTQAIVTPTPGTYANTLHWVAPTAGSGIVSMYLTLLAADGFPIADSNDISGHVSITLSENLTTAVQSVNTTLHFTAYPNPVNNALHLNMSDCEPGIYTISVFDLNGKMISGQTININGALAQQTINTVNWPAGIYQVVAEKDGVYQRIVVVK